MRQATYRPLLSPFSRTGANRAELEAAAQRVKDGIDVLAQVRVFEEMGFEKTGLEKLCQEATNLLEKATTHAVSEGLAALKQATSECVDAVGKVPDPQQPRKAVHSALPCPWPEPQQACEGCRKGAAPAFL